MNLREQYDLDLKRVKGSTSEVARRLGISRQALYSRLNSNTSFENVREIWAAMGYEIWKMAYDTSEKKRAKPFDEIIDNGVVLKSEAENEALRKVKMSRSRQKTR